MHNPLDDYLQEIEARLGSLPPKARKSEMHEMRAHLVYDIASRIESGQSEADAMAATLAQFGDVDDVADDLVRTHSRIQALERRTFWRAVAWSLAANFVTHLIIAAIQFVSMPPRTVVPSYSMLVVLGIAYSAGWIALGLRFPTVAVRAVAFLAVVNAVLDLPSTLAGYGVYLKLHHEATPLLVSAGMYWGSEAIKIACAFLASQYAVRSVRKMAFR